MNDTVIQVDHLRKTYGKFVAVDDISFAVAEGEFYALMGPNGSGKSTLSSILASVTNYDSGTVTIHGRSPERAREMLAYIPQENFSVPQLTGRENLLFFASILGLGGQRARQLVDRMLAQVGLTGDADQRFSRYSGGMKKRLELATALFPGIRVLVLDEPTTGLDPAARRDFFSLLRTIKQDRASIFLITHLGTDAEAASRVGLIHRGRIIAEGTPETLRRHHAPEEAVTIETSAQDAACETVLAPFCRGRKVVRLPNGYRLYARDGGRVLPEVVRALGLAGVAVTRTEVARPTLEDVFFTLTEQPMEVRAL
jgi:ABC-2 type transport system ATP-binding protein